MKKTILACLIAVFLFSAFSAAEEGMYPVSEISKLDLKSKGLAVSPLDIFNPDGTSIFNGICKVGGATGSFISDKGLIITNHHVAYGAVQAASSAEQDYLTDGFYAASLQEEVQAPGYVVRITESYADVSEQVLNAVDSEMALKDQADAVEKKIKEIVKEAEEKHPGKRAEVSEMFPGKTYVLFIYTYLRDIRLVYAPPRSIGNFGGETDNWMWPRHTGDFSLLRAYVAPDGSPAGYAQENVPFKPQKVLSIDPAGVQENDFVFMLGYPGRTYRNRTSFFLEYQYNERMPWIVDYYQWEIDLAEKFSQKDRGTAIKLSTRIKWRSNTMKNYRGKLQGIGRLNLIRDKKQEEAALQEFIEADNDLKKEYSGLLDEIRDIYSALSKESRRELILQYLRSGSTLLSAAYTVYEGSIELVKPDLERKSTYMDRNFSRTKQYMAQGFKNYFEPADKAVLYKLLSMASQLPGEQKIQAVEQIQDGTAGGDAIQAFVDGLYAQSALTQISAVSDALEKAAAGKDIPADPAITFIKALYPEYEALEKTQKERKAELDPLLAALLDVRRQYKKEQFIPDANGTLRFTYGYIEGYSPKDAVYYKPFTTIAGIHEKTTGEPPFDTPEKLLSLIRKGAASAFIQPQLKTVPVDMLYSMDTTGGNSGSPVFNAQGSIIGINFDRAFEATINDFAWSQDYSRSIGVDIRYVLWILKEFSGADSILAELGLQ